MSVPSDLMWKMKTNKYLFFIYNIYTTQIHHNNSNQNYMTQKETYTNKNGLVP